MPPRTSRCEAFEGSSEYEEEWLEVFELVVEGDAHFEARGGLCGERPPGVVTVCAAPGEGNLRAEAAAEAAGGEGSQLAHGANAQGREQIEGDPVEIEGFEGGPVEEGAGVGGGDEADCVGGGPGCGPGDGGARPDADGHRAEVS